MNTKNKISLLLLFSLMLVSACTKSCGKEKEPAVGVFFETPAEGEKIKSPFEVKFGLKGMTVRPALEDVKDKTSGHHHLLIDDPQGFVEEGQVVPTTPRHIHYGQGQTSTVVSLPPGVHTLSMQFADGAHLSYGKKMATTITVTVLESDTPEDGQAKPDAQPDDHEHKDDSFHPTDVGN